MDNKVYLQEAFKALDVLNEEDFNLDTVSGQEDFQDFIDTDEKSDFVDIIDPETTEEDELKDDYLGKIILDCCVCHNKIYKDRDEIVFEDDEDVVNQDEECPICYSTDGFKIVGMIAPYEKTEEEEETEVEEKPEEEPEEEIEIEDKEEVEEGCSPRKRNKKLREKFDSDKYDFEEVEEINSDVSVCLDKLSNKYYIVDMTNQEILDGGTKSAKRLIDTAREYFDESLLNPIKDIGSAVGDVLGGVGKVIGGITGQKNEGCDLKEDADISEYQKWVDFDMKKYGRISGVTMRKIKAAGFSVVKDQYGDYEVIADRKDECMMTSDGCHNRPRRGFRKVEEDFERVEIETDKEKMEMTADEEGKVTVTTEPKEETVVPVDDTVQSEINPIEAPEEEVAVEDDLEVESPEEDVDISDFSEEEFDELGESYLKKIYENVVSYKTDNVYNHKNSIIIEGTINFNSGNKKKTSFIFESSGVNKNGKMRLIGENAQITRGKKAFTVSGKANEGKFIAESFKYNYQAKDASGKSTRIYGTLRTSK